MKQTLIIVFAILLCSYNVSSASVYRYEDDEGFVHLTNVYNSEFSKKYNCYKVEKKLKSAKKKQKTETMYNCYRISKNIQEKQIEKKKAPEYSEVPFTFSENMMLQNYLGHDLRKIYEALNTRLKKQKSEFETTAEFNERIERENKLPLLGSINMTDHFALLVKAESTYNADKKSMEISLPLAYSFSRKFSQGIKVQEKVSRDGEYVGSNIFGATVTVTESYTDGTVLVVNNSSAYRASYENMYFTLNDVSVENAKQTKGNLSIICVFKLDSPFIGDDYYHKEATIDSPSVLRISYKLVYGKISEMIVFNNKSGEILRRIANNRQ